jgi:hypothetical protein
MKNRIIITTVLSLCLVALAAYSYNMIALVAYPVPYNPRFGVLTIEDRSGVPFNKIRIHIYDVNGHDVYGGMFPGYPAIWNGRTQTGRMVSPGMYIIKVEAENVLTGLYGKKMLRILVEY